MANAMVHHLKETPLAASLCHLLQPLFSNALVLREELLHINDGDVGMVMVMLVMSLSRGKSVGGGSLGEWLNVA